MSNNMKASMVSDAVLIKGIKLGEAFRSGVIDLIVDSGSLIVIDFGVFIVDFGVLMGYDDELTDDCDCTMMLSSSAGVLDGTEVKIAFHPDELSTQSVLNVTKQ